MANLREATTWTDILIKWHVERYRKRAGWTQTELANQSGVPLRTIQRVENLEHSPKAETLMALAAAFSKHFQTDIDWCELKSESAESQSLREYTARNYDTVPVRAAKSPLDITRLLAGAQALVFDVVADGLPQAAQDAIASFHGDISDWLDIWSDLNPNGQHDAAKSLNIAREEFSQYGLTVVGGQTPYKIKSFDAVHELTLAVIVICEIGSEPEYVLRKRNFKT
jgi:transcriptional regulator with XRE-family HTH domain